MASGPISSWQIYGETMETMRDFLFLCFKITADGDCSHKIKRHLLLRRKVMTNLDSILKSRDITLPTKVHLVGDAIQPSHPLSSLSPPAFNLSQPSGSFPMSQLLASGVQSIGVSASALVLPMNIQD